DFEVEVQPDSDPHEVGVVGLAIGSDGGGNVVGIVDFEMVDAAFEDGCDALFFERAVDDLPTVFRERIPPPASAAHQVVGLDLLCATDRREVDPQQSGSHDHTRVGRFRVVGDVTGVLERPEVMDTFGVAVFDRKLGRRPAGGDQEFVVIDFVTSMGLKRVSCRVAVGHEGVEAEVDIAFVVPHGTVDRHRGRRKFAFGELLYQDTIVEGFALVGDDCDIGIGIAFADRFGRGTPRDSVADDGVGGRHGTPSASGVMWIAIWSPYWGQCIDMACARTIGMKLEQTVRHFAAKQALTTPIIGDRVHDRLVKFHTSMFVNKADPDRADERKDHLDGLFDATMDAYAEALEEGFTEAEAREITHIQVNFDFYNHGWVEMMEIPVDELD